jgi:uncharacterized protein (TIGR01777 family)
MRILVTGGTGFIGAALCARLADAGHQLAVLSRDTTRVREPALGVARLDDLAGQPPWDAVINLAGEPIADKRWSTARQSLLRGSRIDLTEALVDWVRRLQVRPRVWVNASAVGYYGIAESDEPVTEAASGDHSFSSRLCRDWEQAALPAEALGIRTCVLRLGVVLGPDGGALGRMLPAFRLGLGGRLGSGRQWMPWIHRDDVLGIIEHCLASPHLQGPINCTAPNPVTNREFTRLLGEVVRRPTPATMPAWAVRLLFGQMGEELLLSGRRVVPQRLRDAGYRFRFERLEAALADLV